MKVFNGKSKSFDRTWVIVAARESGRSYVLRDEVSDRIYVRNRTHLLPCPEPGPVNVVMGEPSRALKPALKTKITYKRVCIIHPRVVFTSDIEVMDEEGNRTFAEMNMGEEDGDEEYGEETEKGGQ